ncbi:serine hydrolase domain-containing protein [Luteibacter aegosomatissinici]|uniref:serine hydrolase domain-containing protein n=1 Tax=Luteibacter aegosomatissinici TaxID=2911539 RepID=UPI001FF92EE0|nr:serine hydrolase domain-containing protein [Luteibacter aegosomatissinici]UPG95976.1 beta-lactamase family protein [Luteibacter aegosomatissinici]
MALSNVTRLALLVVPLCTLVVTPAAADQGRARSDMGLYVRQCAKAYECSGTYLVAQSGHIIYQGTVGRVSATRRTRLTIDSAYDIGSISKQFTAAAIVRLAEQHRLGLDDPVATHLPGFPYPQVTIRQLLNQTSGVPDVMPHYTQMILDGSARAPVDLDDIVEVLKAEKLPLTSAPGTAFAYSNTGYTLLGKLVATVSGKPYADYLRDEFFIPLGMQHTWVRTPAMESRDGVDRAYGMRVTRNGSIKPFDQVPGLYVYGAGGIYATAGDLLLWTDALQHGKVMSPEHWRQATTPVTLADGSISPYGFGLSLKPTYLGAAAVAHGGHWRGFKSDLTYLPGSDATIIILTNNGEDEEVERARDAFEGILRKDG